MNRNRKRFCGRLLALLAALLCLSACRGPAPQEARRTEPSLPAVVVMSPSEPAEPRQTAPETFESAEPPATEQPPTEPPASPYPEGDTTPTWRPELAERYPPDELCGPELLLEKWMAVEGLTVEDLDRRGCGQLILAVAQPTDGVETLTVCYERTGEGGFAAVETLSRLQGHVGRAGLMHDRRRDSFTSPAGLWALGYAFGNEAPPEGLKLPWRQVTPNSDWVCDDDSPYFNTWQERGDPALTPWSDDVEHLEDYPTAYAWACVIEFNLPPDAVPERGCAIFLHCGERGTAGCVSLPRAEMGAVLRWLDPEKNPHILITGAQTAP